MARRRRNPSGPVTVALAAAAAAVGFVIYKATRSPGEKAKPGDVVTVPFSALEVPDLVPIPLPVGGGTSATIRVTRALGNRLAGKPAGMLDSAPEVTFPRSAVIALAPATPYGFLTA